MSAGTSQPAKAAASSSSSPTVFERAQLDVLSAVGYGVLLSLVLVPMYVPIEKNLNLLLCAFFSIYIGCRRSRTTREELVQSGQALEHVSQSDAMMFPLIGSCVLFGLYIVVQYVSKDYLNTLLSFYFGAVGTYAIASAIQPIVEQFLPLSFIRLPGFEFRLAIPFYNWNAPYKQTLRLVEVLCLAIGGSVVAWYLMYHHWCANNMMGLSFTVTGIEMLSLGSYQVGCILLSGLFFYDIFWVFGTEVMVSVATGLEAPVKLLFPREDIVVLDHATTKFSMLGLGDLVIPGVFIALMLRYDLQRQLEGRGNGGSPFFHSNLVAYMLGLITTLAVMILFEAAQPALLYLVPACLGASSLHALCVGEFWNLWNFKEEEEEEKKSDSPAAAAAATADKKKKST
eukprot:gnl/Hemi2/6743_TR2297_c0_g1_i1.p1 gnl/Hemi2/6743_TR2297_c0_g1~~gnl/Hemi2/6743_TR2297_c0_g1_i1.p1  ORF type:complete len:416 (-),score=159.66 gnl/Hemi2/6743_TR2297_c0_g1_i1:99-1295(-)